MNPKYRYRRSFWQDVYVNRDPPGGLAHLQDDVLMDQRVPLEQQAALGVDIQLHEVLAAIRALKTGKSTSGIVAEVYNAYYNYM